MMRPLVSLLLVCGGATLLAGMDFRSEIRGITRGGVANTGNATAEDVALGKTFSSASLTNATGTSTKNATVGSDALILPAQAFVDNIVKLTDVSTATLNLSSAGITSLDASLLFTSIGHGGNFRGWLVNYQTAFASSPDGINLSNNAIPSAVVNTILAQMILANDYGIQTSIDLSGGTNGAPTGQGLTNKQALIDSGWTVTTN